MSDITCNVVRDLLPLYVDDVLSDDSRKIVDGHLSICTECMDYYKKMNDPAEDYAREKQTDGQEALKKIRKAIINKRLITAITAALCVAAIAAGLFYGIVVHEKYIPYEETGLYVSEGAIRSDREYYKSVGIYTPDGETLFMYMTTTKYTDLNGGGIKNGLPVQSLTEDDLTMYIQDDEGKTTERVCREIYYLPEKKAEQWMKTMKWPDDAEREIEDLKAASVLLWEAE